MIKWCSLVLAICVGLHSIEFLICVDAVATISAVGYETAESQRSYVSSAFRTELKSVKQGKRANRCLLTVSDFFKAAKTMEMQLSSSSDSEFDPVIIRRNLRMSDFRNYLDKNGHKIPVRLRLKFCPSETYDPDEDCFPDADPDHIFGDLIAMAMPSPVHEEVGGDIHHQVIFALLEDYGLKDLKSTGSLLCRIGRICKEPDISFAPRGLKVGGPIKCMGTGSKPFPNLVLEVAYRNESLSQLKMELMTWISRQTSVMVAIGIKIFTTRVDRSRRMLILVYTRNTGRNPQQAVEFGSNIGNAAGLSIFLRLGDLYHGVPLSNDVNPDSTITIDLQLLQESISSALMDI